MTGKPMLRPMAMWQELLAALTRDQRLRSRLMYATRRMNRKMARNGFAETRVVALVTTAALLGAGAWGLARRRGTSSRPAKRRPDMPSLAGGRGLRVEQSVTVMRSPDELYSRWRDLSRLPELMPHLQSVTPVSDKRSRWVARGPADRPLSWEAEVVADEPGRLIAWRSVGDADVDNAGSVRFTPAPGGRGTEIKVSLSYAPPAGRLGDAVSAIFGRGGDREVREDLRRFKQQMEANELAATERRRDDRGASSADVRGGGH